MLATTKKPTVLNGVDVAALQTTIAAIKFNPEIAKFNFRAVNRWMGGDKNRSTIKEFTGALEEQRTGVQAFIADNGEHAVLLGHDEAHGMGDGRPAGRAGRGARRRGGAGGPRPRRGGA